MPVKDVVDPGKVKCSGPGLGAGVRARVPQTFTVDCSQAGRAPLQVAVLGPTGMKCLGQSGGRWDGVPEALLTLLSLPRCGRACGGARQWRWHPHCPLHPSHRWALHSGRQVR